MSFRVEARLSRTSRRRRRPAFFTAKFWSASELKIRPDKDDNSVSNTCGVFSITSVKIVSVASRMSADSEA